MNITTRLRYITLPLLCFLPMALPVSLDGQVAKVLLDLKPTLGARLVEDLKLQKDNGSLVTVEDFNPGSGSALVGIKSVLDPNEFNPDSDPNNRSEFDWKPGSTYLHSTSTEGDLWVGFRMRVPSVNRTSSQGVEAVSYFQVGPIESSTPPGDGSGYYQLHLYSQSGTGPLVWRLREFSASDRIVNPTDLSGGYNTLLTLNALPDGPLRNAYSSSEDIWVVQVRMRTDATGVIRLWRNGEKVADSLGDGRPLPVLADRRNARSTDKTRVKWGPYGGKPTIKEAYYANIRIAEDGGDDGYRMVAPSDLELDNSALNFSRVIPALPAGASSARVTGLPAGWLYVSATRTIQGTTSALTAGARLQIEYISSTGQPVKRIVWALTGDAQAGTADVDNDGIPNSSDTTLKGAINGEVIGGNGDTWSIDLSQYVRPLGVSHSYTVSNPVGGTVSIPTGGNTASFTATPNYTGVPSFTFSATGGSPVATSSATISLSATPKSYVWTNLSTASGLNWNTATHWQGSSVPASSRGAALAFFPSQLLTGSTTSSNNLGALTLNSLSLTGEATGTNSFTVTVNGTDPFTLFNNGSLPPTINLLSDTLSYTINAPIILGTGTVFNAYNSGTFRFNGAITGSGDLMVIGTSGNLILSGDNSYGKTFISDGSTLQIGNDGSSGSLGQGDVVNNGQLRFDRTGTLLVPNLISGDGTLYLNSPTTNPGTIVLQASNTFTGDVTVDSGILKIEVSGALYSNKTIELSGDKAQLLLAPSSGNSINLASNITFLTSNDDTGAIFNQSGSNTLQGSITLTSGAGGTSIHAERDKLTLSGKITTNANDRVLKLRGAAEGVISGVIGNGSGNMLQLEKTDAGTWTLSGKNTYSGETSIKAGTLKLGNSTALGHGGFTWKDTVGAIDDDGGTTLTSGATLDLNGQTDVIEKITLNGTGTSGQGALINSNTTKAASIAGGYVSTLVVTAGGIHSSVPTVSITGGGGTLATASASLGLTDASVTVNASTSSKIAKYSVAPSVSISGGGSPSSPATATALLDPTTGVVTGIKIGFSGAGYTLAPTFSFSGGTQKGGGSFASDTVYPTATGNKTNFTVVALQVTKSGSGYTSVPTVSFNNSNSTTLATVFMSSLLLASTETSIGGPGDIVINPEIKSDNSAYTRTLTKVGSGTVALKGATRGNLAADEGILELYNSLTGNVTVSGTFAQYGPVTGNVSVAGGTFIHSDTVTGNVTVANGGLEQLDGALNVTGNYTLGSTSTDTDATLRVQLRNATTSDKLTVNGTVTLRGKLDVEIASGASLPLDSTITIIDKTSTGTINTRFANRANDSTFTVGKYTFRINYNVGGNNVVLKVESISSSAVTTVPTLLEQWRVTNFGSSVNGGAGRDDADPDGDSFTNFFEYAMGTDPWSRDVGSAVQTQVDAAGKLQISFLRARSDVKYIVEVANSLAGSSPWQPLITDPGSVSLTVRVTVTDTIPVSTIQQRYLRLRMEAK